jgi:hypothetical protein
LAVGPLQVVDLETAQALDLEMETLKVLGRGKGLAMEKELETEREWVMELERAMELV